MSSGPGRPRVPRRPVRLDRVGNPRMVGCRGGRLHTSRIEEAVRVCRIVAGKAPAFEVYASDDQAADVARRIAGLLNDGPS